MCMDIKKAHIAVSLFLLIVLFSIFSTQEKKKKTGGDLLSHLLAVPSALKGLTSLFGMGRGGSPSL